MGFQVNSWAWSQREPAKELEQGCGLVPIRIQGLLLVYVVCPNPLGVLFSWGFCPFLTGVVEVHFLPCLDHHHELGETGWSQRPRQIPGSALHLRGSLLALWVSCLPSTLPDPHPRLAQPEATCLCSGWSRGLWTAGATPRASTELEA